MNATLSTSKARDSFSAYQKSSPIERLFNPRSIALIGATEKEGSVGRTVFENLLAGEFAGEIYPINLHRDTVLGRKAYASIGDVPAAVDLAVITTPAITVPDIVKECAESKVGGAVIISAGFKECGEAGGILEKRIRKNRGDMRIVGPNCLGLMLPQLGLNATFAAGMARQGNVGFISQSGALCTAVLDWSLKENVGFSAFVSLGSMVDVGWGDLIYRLGDDPQTHSIVIYMESVGNARAFLSAAREVSLTKPIVVIKVGRSAAAAKAAASHTGSLTGSDEVLDAAFRRAGVLRVDTIAELFCMAEILGKQPRPRGPRLSIVTNGGGPGALATDMLISQGGEIATLSSASLSALDKLLPAHWSHGNPIDILGDASAKTYSKAVEIALNDSNSDGVLVVLTPQAMTECTDTAEELGRVVNDSRKPVLASWMGGEIVAAGERALNAASIPTFSYPDSAARAFCGMWKYSRNLESLYETPTSADLSRWGWEENRTNEIISHALNKGRHLLTEVEAKQILADYGIPVAAAHVAVTVQDAIEAAEKIGYPVVLKLHSETVTHKTDVGGVKLNLQDEQAVVTAFEEIQEAVASKAESGSFQGVTVQPMVQEHGHELIVGSSTDPQFGPVLLFGAGGQFVEVLKDRALGLPPLNATLARRMMERTRIYRALHGVRGEGPVDLEGLEHLLVRFSNLVTEHPRIKEIDINPLLVSPRCLLALDARIVLHDSSINDGDLPALAIRPYPNEYVTHWQCGEVPVTIRPIKAEDEPLMVSFHKSLSDRTVHARYFNAFKLENRIRHERLTRICFNDYDREIALVAVRRNDSAPHEILGVARLIKEHRDEEAEFAVVICDRWQGCGLGSELLDQLIKVAKKEGVNRLVGHILPTNFPMRHICKKAGFRMFYISDALEWRAELTLKSHDE